MSENKEESTKARMILEKYLKENHLRKTPERFAILEATYTFTDAFDINDMREKMLQTKFKTSLSTIYNTFILLEKAHLLLRSKPNGRYSKFTANHHTETKVYLMCTQCGSMRPVSNSRITKSLQKTKWPRFYPQGFMLYIQGTCYGCQKKNDKEQNNNK